jgi:hypothetical protein
MEKDMISDITHVGEPSKILDDCVQFVAMDHKQALSTRGRMDAA